jgi:hypothetical protein
MTRQGKSLERCITMLQMEVPLIYDGPRNIDDLFKSGRLLRGFLSASAASV